MIEFNPFPKMPRLSRGMVITEKIDGTNASVHIRPAEGNVLLFGTDTQVDIDGAPHYIRAGSRTRWISVEDDNYGFAAWVYQHAPDLARLGPGHHFGEWWGRGIQRNYGQTERHFSLFNTGRWVQYEGNVTTDTPQQTFTGPSYQTFSITYLTATNATNYQVTVNIVHANFGSFSFKQYLLGEYAKASSPFGLDFLGSIGVSTAAFIPALLIIFVAGCFSELSSEAAAVITTIIAIILAAMGWISISSSALVIALSLSIMAGIVGARKRMQYS